MGFLDFLAANLVAEGLSSRVFTFEIKFEAERGLGFRGLGFRGLGFRGLGV